MTKDYRAKVFKSGNSLALRLPKALGIGEGEDVVIAAHDDGSFTLWKSSDAKAVFMRLFGSMSDGYMANGRSDVSQGERDWSDPASSERAA